MAHLATVAIVLSITISDYKQYRVSGRRAKVIYHSTIVSMMEAQQPYPMNWESKSLAEFYKKLVND